MAFLTGMCTIAGIMLPLANDVVYLQIAGGAGTSTVQVGSYLAIVNLA